LTLAAAPARGDVYDEIKKSGTLIWGGDKAGGGPYVFPDPNDAEKIVGFEVDLAAELAKELGVKPVFKQGQWELVPQLAEKGEIHVALNGYESKPAIARDYLMSRPYYAFGLQLMARTDAPFANWEEAQRVGSKNPLTIGVLNSSAADGYVRDKAAGFAKPSAFDGTTDALEAVLNRQIDATLTDDCAALYYSEKYPTLRFIDRAVGGSTYVVLMKKGEDRLKAALDAALEKMIADGRLERIYDKWKLSGRVQMQLIRTASAAKPAAKADFAELLRTGSWSLLQAAGMTVFLSCVSMPLAILLGVLLAVGRLYGPTPVRWFAALYVEVIRGTPLMLQLYALYFLLPKIGLSVPALAAAIVGLAINYSAYEAEIYRAGLQAIPRGQWEAALALGMTPRQTLLRIILPQAFRIVIPPVTNDFIALFKDTSVCSVVTVMELTKQYNILAMSTGAIVETAILTAVLYMAMSYPLSLFARWSERKLGTQHRPLV
jgi:polar amino acid transport system substrate-binding protein